MIVPKSIKNLIEAFERLPGIGPKTAARLTFYLLHVPEHELDSLARAVARLKKDTVICSICFNVAEEDPCPICSSPNRERTVLAVVETPLDVLALERAGFKGLYHVLHGVIDPLNNVGPDELKIRELLRRVFPLSSSSAGRNFGNGALGTAGSGNQPRRGTEDGNVGKGTRGAWSYQEATSAVSEGEPAIKDNRGIGFEEIILATNPSVEGEATAMYIKRELKAQSAKRKADIKITRLARGLPVGGDLEYADDVTLSKAIEGRTEY